MQTYSFNKKNTINKFQNIKTSISFANHMKNSLWFGFQNEFSVNALKTSYVIKPLDRKTHLVLSFITMYNSVIDFHGDNWKTSSTPNSIFEAYFTRFES